MKVSSKFHGRTLRRACVLSVTLALSALASVSVYAQEKWVGTWASAQQGVNLAFGGVTPVFSNQTLRQIARVSIGGSSFRIRFSNVLGAESLTIDAASVAKRLSGSTIDSQSLRELTFAGSGRVTIPDGAFVLSDPVSLNVEAFEDLAISAFLGAETGIATQHSAALQTNYVSTPGDHTASTEFPVESTNESWYMLSGIDVMASADTQVIATFGDSITDGTNSTADSNSRYPDFLANRIAANSGNAAVLNFGIAGNRVLHSVVGPNALSRFDRDVIARPGVTHVILLEGINDIGLPGLLGAPEQEVTAEQITAGYRQLIERARTHDIKVIGSTLLPYRTAIYYTEEGDEKRQMVNDWIRNSNAFDGFVDFDLALRDPENPLQILPEFDSGDNLHPSDAGYQAMAEAVDLALLGIEDIDSGGGNVVRGSRYDSSQGEIFWQKQGFTRFNIFRDGVLQTAEPIDANSFYQNSLDDGIAYQYEVIALDTSGNVVRSLGTVVVPTNNAAEQ